MLRTRFAPVQSTASQQMLLVFDDQAPSPLAPQTIGNRRPNYPLFLRDGGEAGKALRETDWSATLLGAAPNWSPALKAAVRMMLTTDHPVFIFWGPEHVCLHNDAFDELLDPELPRHCFGLPGRDAWKDTWGTIGPVIDAVMRNAKSWHDYGAGSIEHRALKDFDWRCRYQPVIDPTVASGIGGVLVI